MAGIIAAQDDGQGITGIDPSAEILSIRILDCQNRCSLSRLIAGIKKAEEMEADIISMVERIISLHTIDSSHIRQGRFITGRLTTQQL